MGDVQEIVSERAAELVASGKERDLHVAAHVDGRLAVSVAGFEADRTLVTAVLDAA